MKYSKSNKVVFIILSFFIFLGVTKAFAQDEKQIISLFEKKVDKFQKFFSSKPKLLSKYCSSKFPEFMSPTGCNFSYLRFDSYTISYDVRKTNSLVSPYMGDITVKYLETMSTKCGDFEFPTAERNKEPHKFFSTLELARQKRDDESCYKPFSAIPGRGIERSAKFIFAFQKKNWVYKDVVNTEDNKPDSIFYNAFGKPVSGEQYVEDNNFWKKLIE